MLVIEAISAAVGVVCLFSSRLRTRHLMSLGQQYERLGNQDPPFSSRFSCGESNLVDVAIVVGVGASVSEPEELGTLAVTVLATGDVNFIVVMLSAFTGGVRKT